MFILLRNKFNVKKIRSLNFDIFLLNPKIRTVNIIKMEEFYVFFKTKIGKENRPLFHFFVNILPAMPVVM